MMGWLESIPTDKLEETYQSLKDELTEHYREELKQLQEHPIMLAGKRAGFYNLEKELCMKMILLAGGYEVTVVMNEYWEKAVREIPTHHYASPSFHFSS
ncbi:MAG TPA: hypothetical protein VNG51_02610 [Ktedonobacteraceae bacterium]|nr:hypothetical protein [Ktedonobacteraceae bacterium]